MDNRMTRRRKQLYTRQALADVMGCSVDTVDRLERSFLTRRQVDYLNAVQYKVGFYPVRKPKRLHNG